MTDLERKLVGHIADKIYAKELPVLGKWLQDNRIPLVGEVKPHPRKACSSIIRTGGVLPNGAVVIWYGENHIPYIDVRADVHNSDTLVAVIFRDGTGNIYHDLLGAMVSDYMPWVSTISIELPRLGPEGLTTQESPWKRR